MIGNRIPRLLSALMTKQAKTLIDPGQTRREIPETFDKRNATLWFTKAYPCEPLSEI
jgi:hypothetical protein